MEKKHENHYSILGLYWENGKMETTGIIIGLILRSRKFQDCCGIAMQAKLAGKTRRLRAAWRAKVLVWRLGVLGFELLLKNCVSTL